MSESTVKPVENNTVVVRTIVPTGKYEQDYKRLRKSGNYKKVLEEILPKVIENLANNQSLAENFQDHDLQGEWIDHRDCHIRDLVLIYQKLDKTNELKLTRIGTHSELKLQ